MNCRILFIGRLEKDLGLEIYFQALDILKVKADFAGDGNLRKEAEKHGKVLGFVNLKKIINNYDIIFASSYLSILESLIHKKPVIAAFNNPLKEDYLKMSPFYKYINITDNPSDISLNKKFSQKGYEWAKKQTWENVTNIYLKLWQKHL